MWSPRADTRPAGKVRKSRGKAHGRRADHKPAGSGVSRRPRKRLVGFSAHSSSQPGAYSAGVVDGTWHPEPTLFWLAMGYDKHVRKFESSLEREPGRARL